MPSLCQHLREANGRIGPWLEHAAGDLEAKSPAAPEQLNFLLSELLHTGAALRAETIPAAGSDLELDVQLATYRGHVERLRTVLPLLHRQLLREKARVEAQRVRVRAAAEWARASRQTL